METTAADGASADGGIWNWEDLPEDIQLDFQQSYFSASQTVYQQEVSRAFSSAQG